MMNALYGYNLIKPLPVFRLVKFVMDENYLLWQDDEYLTPLGPNARRECASANASLRDVILQANSDLVQAAGISKTQNKYGLTLQILRNTSKRYKKGVTAWFVSQSDIEKKSPSARLDNLQKMSHVDINHIICEYPPYKNPNRILAKSGIEHAAFVLVLVILIFLIVFQICEVRFLLAYLKDKQFSVGSVCYKLRYGLLQMVRGLSFDKSRQVWEEFELQRLWHARYFIRAARLCATIGLVWQYSEWSMPTHCTMTVWVMVIWMEKFGKKNCQRMGPSHWPLVA
jgi:hypothetical protein